MSGKINKLFKLMELFVQKKTICKNGNIMNRQGIVVERIEDFGINVRNLCRYLEDIIDNYSHIVEIKKSASKCYKLENSSEIFHKFLINSNEISFLLEIIHMSKKNILDELAQDTKENLEKLANSSKDERDIFLFQGLPFDELQKSRRRDVFNMLKLAIKNREYRNIHYHYDAFEIFKNSQCLKLIFMDSNWYLAINSKESGFRLLRMAFITHVEYSKMETYQYNQLIKYRDYFKNIQNPMTLYGAEKQKAHFLASPKVAKYFKSHMKKYLNSQTFIEEREDGSIEFSLEYTQSLEVLPFIKRWLPDVEVLSPVSLQETMVADLRSYLEKFAKINN